MQLGMLTASGVGIVDEKHLRKWIFFFSRYELLFGITSADATFALNNRQLEYGLEPEERNRIFSDFVSSNYGLHQREIFAAIVNEYTDWQSAAQHPVNIRDKTLEALTDAHFVAPIIETGDYHSSLNARSWAYVFDYQTKNSYYKQVRKLNILYSYYLHYTLGSSMYLGNCNLAGYLQFQTFFFSSSIAWR